MFNFKKFRRVNNFLAVLLIFLMMAGWLFSGWPRVWDSPSVPPEIQEVRAATTDTYYGTYDSANSDMTNSSYAETDNTQYAYGAKNKKAVIQSWSGTAGSGTISGVRIYCQHYAATPDGNDFTLVEYSLDNWVSTGVATGQQVMPDSEASFSVDITADRSPWNWTDIGNLEVRATAKADGKENFGNDYIDVLYIQVDYTPPNITVGTGGTQTANVDVNSSDNYVGGYFTFVRDAGSANVTEIIVSETGTVNANSNLSNLDIYYETAETCVYNTGEDLFGTAASFDGSENATVTGTMAVGTSQICVYIVLDVGSGASADETVLIEISASPDVTVSAGTVSAATWPVAIADTTTLQAGASLTFIVTTDNFGDVTAGSHAHFATSTLNVNTDNSSGWNVTLYGNNQGSDSASTTMYLTGPDYDINFTDQLEWIPGSATTTHEGATSVQIGSFDNNQNVLAFRVMTASSTNGLCFFAPDWWGTADDYADNANALWAGIASSSAADLKIGDSSISSGGSDALNTVLYYLKVPSTQQSGNYTGDLTFTATTN